MVGGLSESTPAGGAQRVPLFDRGRPALNAGLRGGEALTLSSLLNFGKFGVSGSGTVPAAVGSREVLGPSGAERATHVLPVRVLLVDQPKGASMRFRHLLAAAVAGACIAAV